MFSLERRADVLPGEEDMNPVLDEGCPRSIGGIENTRKICKAMGIQFKIRGLDCEPFLHGYGEESDDSKVVVGIWYMPITDMSEKTLLFPST